MSIGIGYNPLIIKNPTLIPSFVDFVECGPHDLSNFIDHRLSGNLSIHIARSPMCEDYETQDCFIDKIVDVVNEFEFVSMGFHIIGPRLSGIGKYGFSSHYDAGDDSESRIIRFVKAVQDKFGKPVWLENVNFYSESTDSVFRTYESINKICAKTDAGMLADLTHLYVDAYNVGIDPRTLIGAIQWSTVVEVHLAGTISSSDGAKHDGHSQPVPSGVWDLYETVMDYKFVNDETIVTIEHTDPDWSTREDQYKNDYVRALEIKQRLGYRSEMPFELDPERFAIGYIKKKLLKGIPNLRETVDQSGFTLDEMISSWIKNLNEKNINLVLNEETARFFRRGDNVEFYGSSFVKFCNRRLGL